MLIGVAASCGERDRLILALALAIQARNAERGENMRSDSPPHPAEVRLLLLDHCQQHGC
jgi:hypothetical protein